MSRIPGVLWALFCLLFFSETLSFAQPHPKPRAGTPLVAPAPIPRNSKPLSAAVAASKATDKSSADVSSSPEMSVADLAAKVRDSTVVISVLGRDRERSALGAGFVIGKNGLIATNLHVIGEARPIVVTTSDSRKLPVTEIHATDQAMDLAILRVGATDLKPLELGDSSTLKQGEEVAALGNPRGLERSVVSGVVSATRVIDGKPMIQLAMPIEQGNSGGPLLDRRGRVQGIVTMKSVVTENLGFAVAINAIKPLLSRPNPVPIARWLTIGAIDGKEWTARFGGRWRQRAGRLVVEGPGEGFGGRTLLISRRSLPKRPFEVAVWVRLKREDGAAGLVFDFNEPDRHYGFYPSNGRIRLTRFDGPDVYSWHVLSKVHTPAYRPGEWNRLKVRLQPGKLLGYVNDVLVVESNDDDFQNGQAGLAGFRDTSAQFKGFGIGANLPPVLPSPELMRRVERIAAAMQLDQPADPKSIEPLAASGEAGVRALRQQADHFERQAKQLRRLAETLQSTQIKKQLVSIFDRKPEKEIDLLRAALLIARMDNEDVDVEAYVREIDRMADAVRSTLPKQADAAAKQAALDDYLFKKLGFHGSRTDFYNRSNSYLNEVIDDREGLPITLAVLYIELARRLGVETVGIGLPGRFLVRLASGEGKAPFVDVFDGGHRLSHDEAEAQARLFIDRAPTAEEWQVQPKKQIVQRLVQNLAGIAEEANDAEGMLRYVELSLAIDPGSVVDHWQRAWLCYQTGRTTESLEEANWLLARDPQKLSEIVHPGQVEQLKKLLESHP